MVGIGTSDVNLDKYRHTFCSLLGKDEDSWGLSYTGKYAVEHHKHALTSTTVSTKCFFLFFLCWQFIFLYKFWSSALMVLSGVNRSIANQEGVGRTISTRSTMAGEKLIQAVTDNLVIYDPTLKGYYDLIFDINMISFHCFSQQF